MAINQNLPPTPPSIKTNDIPLTSFNSMFVQTESPVKTYSFVVSLLNNNNNFVLINLSCILII